MLRIDKLKVGDLPALTFEVADGECLAIEGPSGTGKTRLLRAIADLDASSGQVFLDGAERSETPAVVWRRAVRYCAAETAWWTPTARPVFDLAEAATGAERSKAKVKCDRLLTAVGLGPDVLDRQISLLSTGERQRLALIRAVLDEPKVVLFDEPTGSLDAANGALVEELIRFQLLAGRIVLLVSHDVRQIERLAHSRLQLAGKLEGTR